MKAEDPMAMMREAHRSYPQVTSKLPQTKNHPQDFADGFEICSIGGEPNELFQHPLRKSAGRNGTWEYRYRPDGESAAHQSGHDGEETGGQIAAASGRGVPDARDQFFPIVQYRSTVPGRKGRARRIKHLAQLVDYFVFLLGRCARALAAAVLLALPVRPSRSTFDAAVSGSGACLLGIAQCAASFLWRIVRRAGNTACIKYTTYCAKYQAI